MGNGDGVTKILQSSPLPAPEVGLYVLRLRVQLSLVFCQDYRNLKKNAKSRELIKTKKAIEEIPMDTFFYKNSSGEGRFATTLYNIACELESYRKDIFRGKKEGIDRYFLNSLIKDYMVYQMQLEYMPGKSDPDTKEIRKKLQSEFPPIVN